MDYRKSFFAFFTTLLFGVVFLFSSCQENDPDDIITVSPAVVFFKNDSGYTVDVYKYRNPEQFDPDSLIRTISPVSTERVEQYPSADQIMGDSFFVRYRVLLPFAVGIDTTQVYAHAERVLFNLTFVIKGGEEYTKTIPQPAPGELRVINSYILVNNHTNAQIQTIRGTSILPKYDKSGVFINTGGRSYYEIEFPYYNNAISMNEDEIKALSTTGYIPFPSFTMDRGKIYEFTVQEDRVTGPVVRNILTE